MKIAWVRDLLPSAGNGFGYFLTAQNIKQQFLKKGVLAKDYSETDTAFIIGSPESLRIAQDEIQQALKEQGLTRLWIFTMIEGDALPPEHETSLRELATGGFIVPCNHVKRVFEEYFDVPIVIAPLGVNRVFQFKKRKFPRNRPFRVLWNGAPNARKGWDAVAIMWKEAGFVDHPEFELYIKTTQHPGVERRGNVILDGRTLSPKGLRDMYWDAHCYLFPTRGEGFGLTLTEAMRTGLPCVAPTHTAMEDYFDEHVGYPIKSEPKKVPMSYVSGGDPVPMTMHFPDVGDMLDKLKQIYVDYRRAVKKGEKASKRIKARYTWETTVDKIMEGVSQWH